MKRKAYRFGLVAVALTIIATLAPFSSRIATSRQNFREYFQDLNQSGNSLNPLERVVFSLVLANSDLAQNRK